MKRYLHINVLTVVFKIVPKKWDVPKKCLLAVQDSYEKVFADYNDYRDSGSDLGYTSKH